MHIKGGYRAYSAVRVRTTHHVRDSFAQNADHLAHDTPLSAFFAEVVCTLGATPPRTATSPPANGGNCTNRATTRRRHAEGRLLMLQNPHRQRCDALRKGQRARAGPGAACFPMTPPPNGGNCTNRATTRRRHAVVRLLVVQNPPSSKMRRSPKGSESAGGPGRGLLSNDTATKQGELRRKRRTVELGLRRGHHQTGGIAPIEARHAGDTPKGGS